jgi:hypothetical protein
MRKWIIFFFVICLALLPNRGYAQQEITLSSLEIKLWPEYDTPEMLVIYNFELPETTSLPVDVHFRIPATAGQLYGYGYYPDGGGLPVQENYQQQMEVGWLDVSFTMRSLVGTLEYYDPALLKNGIARHFEYFWPGDYALEALRILVQEPVDAEMVQISPAANSTFTDANGLLTHLITVNRQPANATFSLSLDYQKSTARLSVAEMPVEPVSALPTETTFLLSSVAAVLILAGVLVIGAAVAWFWFSTPRSKPAAAPRRRKRALAAPPAEPGMPLASQAGNDHEGVYCHQCGRRATAGDRFCRSCGTQLRVD